MRNSRNKSEVITINTLARICIFHVCPGHIPNGHFPYGHFLDQKNCNGHLFNHTHPIRTFPQPSTDTFLLDIFLTDVPQTRHISKGHFFDQTYRRFTIARLDTFLSILYSVPTYYQNVILIYIVN